MYINNMIRMLGCLLAALQASACARRTVDMPRRMVADPITLPRGMHGMSLYGPLSGDRDRRSVSDELVSPVSPRELSLRMRYGLSDRLELEYTSLLGLSYAIIEDVDRSTGEGRAPLALKTTGGLRYIGYSSVEGWIVDPVAGITAVVRPGRLRVEVGQELAAPVSRFRRGLRSTSHVQAMLSLADGIALEGGGRLIYHRDPSTTGPSTYTTELGLGLGWRPRRWVTVDIGGTAHRIFQKETASPLPSPDSPISGGDRSTPWDFPVWLRLGLHWGKKAAAPSGAPPPKPSEELPQGANVPGY